MVCLMNGAQGHRATWTILELKRSSGGRSKLRQKVSDLVANEAEPGDLLDELTEGIAVLEVVKEGLHGNPGATEDRSSPQDVRIEGDQIRRIHNEERTARKKKRALRHERLRASIMDAGAFVTGPGDVLDVGAWVEVRFGFRA